MATALVSHSSCRLHDPGPHHPDSPRRLDAIDDRLLETGVTDLLAHFEAPAVSREQLLRVHDAGYLDWLKRMVPERGLQQIDPDTQMGPQSLLAASHAAGAVILATDLVLTGRVHNAFCNIRPPGHHASRDRAMGFCFYNNLAVGVAHALESHELERVAVFDFDVHHGNGTDVIFAQDPRVLVCSVFQQDLYPFGTGLPHSGLGVELALSSGSGEQSMRSAVADSLLPAMRAFEPQALFLSTGFDAHWADPIADQRYTDADFDWLTRQALSIAADLCGGRLVSVLEGGYDLAALGRCATAHIRLLAGL